MNFCAFSSRSIDRREDRHVGMRGLDRGDALGRRDDAEQPDVARAGLLQRARWRRPRCRRSRASDRRRAPCCSTRLAGSFGVVARRDGGVSRRAAGRCDRRARAAAARAPRPPCRGRRAAPARRRRRRRAPRPAACSSGVSTRASAIGSLRVASIATIRLSRCASRRKWLAVVARSRSDEQGVLRDRMLHEMDGHAQNYTRRASRIWPMRCVAVRGRRWSALVGVVAVLVVTAASGRPGERVSLLVITGGTVVTMDAHGTRDSGRRRRDRRRPDRRRRARATRSAARYARGRAHRRRAARSSCPVSSTRTRTRRWCCTAGWPTTWR